MGEMQIELSNLAAQELRVAFPNLSLEEAAARVIREKLHKKKRVLKSTKRTAINA